ncbi:hypothetical protein SpCBS45565_g03814 [Spizellomyces sp. 'palustris']|nr:hypothetical protein SpCBS45565_g03814 [Spizellomyces sp. 'palustris']
MAESSGSISEPGALRASASTEFPIGDTYESTSTEDLRKDPKYRRYVNAVDKILQSFDTISEWADVIGFLTRLAKTLQAHSGHSAIPQKLVIAKRLAQCLNPALPAGVHQKTLDVYGLIFEASGTTQLAEDLPLWSCGLFPFLQNSPTTVKPQILALYEKFYLPLGLRLKPSLKALILALLPSLEEENNEYFDRVMGILDGLVRSVGQGYFYHCIWLSLISVPHLRLAAVNYLLRRMPKVSSAEDVAVVLGNDTSLLARALSAVLEDKVLLVQRGGLELLLVHFPLKYGLFHGPDLVLLLGASAGVVLRKDMSLNRRLYAWLLGSADSKILADECKFPLTSALRAMFYTPSADFLEISKPYKIMISLMDKTEIGQPLLRDLFPIIFHSLKQQMDSSTHQTELLQTATMFLDMVDPLLIWTQLYRIVRNASLESMDKVEGYQGYELLDFALSTFKWSDDETQRVHLPFLFKIMTSRLTTLLSLPETLAKLPLYLRLIGKLEFLISDDVLSHSWSLRDFVGASMEELPPTDPAGNGNGELLSAAKHTSVEQTKRDMVAEIDEFYEMADNASGALDPFRQHNILVGRHILQSGFSDLLAFVARLITDGILHEHQGERPANEALDRIAVDAPVSSHRRITRVFGQVTTIIQSLVVHLDPLDREAQLWRMSQGEVQQHYTEEDVPPPSVSEGTGTMWLVPLMNAAHMVNDFPVLNAALSCLLSLLTSKIYPIPEPPHFNHFVCAVTQKLWMFLGPEEVRYHSRAVELIWALCSVSSSYIMENVMAQQLTCGTSSQRLGHFEKFGIFWRLSEEAASHASMLFSRPLFIMLDALRSKDPLIRRGGETWFRSYVKSYIRILDPLLAILLHRDIRRISKNVRVSGEDVALFYYAAPFNQAQVDYAYETLLGILNFGDRLFLRSIWMATVKLPDLVNACRWMEEDYNMPNNHFTYAELLIALSLRYLQSEPLPHASTSEINLIESIQARAAEFLLIVLSRSDYVNYQLVSVVQGIVIRKLLYCIFACKLDVQPRMLQVLHGIAGLLSSQRVVHEVGAGPVSAKADVPVSAAMDSMLAAEMKTESQEHTESSDTKPNSNATFPRLRTIGSSPILVRTLLDALSIHTNRPVLQHYMDFILSSLPHLRNSFRRILLPIIQCLCDELRKYQDGMRKYMSYSFERLQSNGIDPGDEQLSMQAYPELDVLVLLYGLEKLIAFCLAEGGLDSTGAKGGPPGAGGTSFRFLTGYVASVFGSDERGLEAETAQQRMTEVVLNLLPSILRNLQELYGLFDICSAEGQSMEFRNKPDQSNGQDNMSMSFTFLRDRIRFRIRKVLEATYKLHPSDTIESLIEVWLAENGSHLDKEEKGLKRTAIAMMGVIHGSTPRSIVTTVLDILKERGTVLQGASQRDRIKKTSLKAPTLPDISLVLFLEKYCALWASAETLKETWPYVATYVKEASAQASAFKHLFLPILRLLNVYFEKFATLPQFEDKRILREAEDLYQKVCDYCILIAGRSFDHGSWRKSVQAADTDTANADQLGIGGRGDATTVLPLPEIDHMVKRLSKVSDDSLVQEVVVFFGSSLVPSLRRFLLDQDRVFSLLSNMVYYMVAPLFRNKQSAKALVNPILELVCAMTTLPAAHRAWRREAWDAFLDPKFFEMGIVASRKWRVIVQAMVSSDKEKIADLIGRVSAVPSATLFMSKDQETTIRAYAVRRLSFVIFSGAMDQYVPQLPGIQEKLVDIFKVKSDVMHVEAYLCLRVLLCRISTHHLANFWPTVLTELIRVFEMYLRGDEARSAESTAAFLAACKFLDLLLVLQIEEFQWYQWIFITETLEVLQDANNAAVRPVAFVDKLYTKWSGHLNDSSMWTQPSVDSSPPEGLRPVSDDLVTSLHHQVRRRPLLTARSISDKRELLPFFHSASRYIYETTYALAKPDIEFVENMLESEFLFVDDAAIPGFDSTPRTSLTLTESGGTGSPGAFGGREAGAGETGGVIDLNAQNHPAVKEHENRT